MLLDGNNNPLRASKYAVNENGKMASGDRAGGNDWPVIADSKLFILITYSQNWALLNATQQETFKKNSELIFGWGPSTVDNSFSHLRQTSGQLYASKGYELQKTNYA
jgi:hypothetical protein